MSTAIDEIDRSGFCRRKLPASLLFNSTDNRPTTIHKQSFAWSFPPTKSLKNSVWTRLVTDKYHSTNSINDIGRWGIPRYSLLRKENRNQHCSPRHNKVSSMMITDTTNYFSLQRMCIGEDRMNNDNFKNECNDSTSKRLQTQIGLSERHQDPISGTRVQFRRNVQIRSENAQLKTNEKLKLSVIYDDKTQQHTESNLDFLLPQIQTTTLPLQNHNNGLHNVRRETATLRKSYAGGNEQVEPRKLSGPVTMIPGMNEQNTNNCSNAVKNTPVPGTTFRRGITRYDTIPDRCSDTVNNHRGVKLDKSKWKMTQPSRNADTRAENWRKHGPPHIHGPYVSCNIDALKSSKLSGQKPQVDNADQVTVLKSYMQNMQWHHQQNGKQLANGLQQRITKLLPPGCNPSAPMTNGTEARPGPIFKSKTPGSQNKVIWTREHIEAYHGKPNLLVNTCYRSCNEVPEAKVNQQHNVAENAKLVGPRRLGLRLRVTGANKNQTGIRVPATNRSLLSGDFGDDAGMIFENPQFCFLALADGAGGNRNRGIDPSIFSRSLMASCYKVLRAGSYSTSQLLQLVTAAMRKIETLNVLGSATLCVVGLDRYGHTLHTLNIGDSGVRVVRNKRIIFKTKKTMNGSSPCQLFLIDHTDLFKMGVLPTSFIRESEIKEDSSFQSVKVQHGDIIVMSSDGLWDVVDDNQLILTILGNKSKGIQGISDCLLKIALKAYAGPFRDDILIIMSEVKQLQY